MADRSRHTPTHDEQVGRALFAAETARRREELGDRAATSDAERAQALAFRAMVCADPDRALELAEEALELDPDCLDALRVETLSGTDDPAERVDGLRRAVEVGFRRLGGAEFLEANRGRMGERVLARPYLRTRATLADFLLVAGRVDEARAEMEECLSLDPEDLNGVRRALQALLLERRDLAAWRDLARRYPAAEDSHFAWGAVLERFLTGGRAAADAAWSAAVAANPHVPACLLDPATPGQASPTTAEPGSEREALEVALRTWPAWASDPAATAWLEERAGPLPPDVQERRRVGRAHRLPGTPPDAVPEWVRALFHGPEVEPAAVLRVASARPDEAKEWLVHLLGDASLDELTAPGCGLVPAQAAYLLGRLRIEAAVGGLVAAIRRAPASAVLGVAAAEALGTLGPAAVEPCLAALPGAPVAARVRLLEALATCGVKDERIYAALLAAFAEDPLRVAGLLADYGDPRAVEPLSAALDATDMDFESAGRVFALQGALTRLGGTPTGVQRRKFEEAVALGRDGDRGVRDDDGDVEEGDLDDLLDGEGGFEGSPEGDEGLDEEGTPLERVDRPGRNDPCWCGSGKKYKRCHLAPDEEQDASERETGEPEGPRPPRAPERPK